jgi:hypothetical protein
MSTGSAEDTAALENQFLARIRDKGGRAGNVTLKRELGWDDDPVLDYSGPGCRLRNLGTFNIGPPALSPTQSI